MRKKLITVLAILALLLTLLPAAFADDTQYFYVNVGENIYQQLMEFPNGTGYTYDLPSGLYLQEDGHAGQMGLILCGAIWSPGTYDANIYVDGMGTWSYRFVVNDPSPTPTHEPVGPVRQPPSIVFATRGQECGVDDYCTLYVEVSNPGGYDLYYSWYKDGAWYQDGSSSIYADTSRAGTSYYSCEVGYTINGNYNSITSNSIPVKVNAPHVLDYIYIYENPYKNMYSVGEYLNTDGLAIGLTYLDGDEQMIRSGFTCDPTYMDKPGTKTIGVYYGGCYTSFNVSVREKVVISGVSVYTLPNKLNYNVGDKLDTTGLSLRVNYSDGGSSVYSNGFSCSPTSFTAEGNQTVTVTYEGKTTSFDVNVQDPSKTTGISVDRLPNKVEYNPGDQLDVSGLRIKVSTKGGSEVVDALNNSKFSFDPVVLNTEGQQLITVTYKDGGKKYDCQFNVQVKKNAKAPVSPTPTAPTAAPSAAPQTTADSGNHVLLIVLGVALFVILALIVCVFVMMRRNRDELEGLKVKEKLAAEREWRKNHKNSDGKNSDD